MEDSKLFEVHHHSMASIHPPRISLVNEIVTGVDQEASEDTCSNSWRESEIFVIENHRQTGKDEQAEKKGVKDDFRPPLVGLQVDGLEVLDAATPEGFEESIVVECESIIARFLRVSDVKFLQHLGWLWVEMENFEGFCDVCALFGQNSINFVNFRNDMKITLDSASHSRPPGCRST